MSSSEYDPDEMVLLYNPAADHRCNLKNLNVLNQYLPVQPRTILECDQCAQRWWAYIDYGDCTKNKWRKLRWYHWILRSKIA